MISASGFGGAAAIAPGTWVEIYGSRLSPNTRSWTGGDFDGANAPTALDGVRVTIDGKPAFVYYISGSQINALAPSDISTGPVGVTVRNADGTSDAYTVESKPLQPGLLATPLFVVGGKQYAAAIFTDGRTFALPEESIPGVPTRAAKPGETLLLYGIGFGRVTPHITAGKVVGDLTCLEKPVQATIGGVAAKVDFQGLMPSATGLYQFNVIVPDVPDNDVVPLGVSMDGGRAEQTLHIAVRR